ncbi:hypothetical protein [Caldivirga sp.]|uniref:hypothetical protein n=1 Tax=Caldivirga sp. TaxID=2080243 RepID=UPI003D13DF94
MGITEKFIEAFLAIYRDYKGKWGIMDVYAYRTQGKSTKAFASLIINIRGNPRTINAYLFSTGKVMIVTDVTPVFRGKVNCTGSFTRATVDMYLPPEEYNLCISEGINGSRGILLALTKDYGEERVMLYSEVDQGSLNYNSLVKVLGEVKDILHKLFTAQ